MTQEAPIRNHNTMYWELLARIYSELAQRMSAVQPPWQIHYYRQSVKTKIATRRAKFRHVAGEPVEAVHKSASDWCLRLIPPNGSSYAQPIIVTSRDENFFVKCGKRKRQIQFLAGDSKLPLSIHNPLAAELVAAEVLAMIQEPNMG